jgi:hypothetical protein
MTRPDGASRPRPVVCCVQKTFFHGGVWFQPRGGRFIVTIPPVGTVIGVNVISHVLVSHLIDAERCFAEEYPHA